MLKILVKPRNSKGTSYYESETYKDIDAKGGSLVNDDFTREIRFVDINSRDTHISQHLYVRCGDWTLEELLDLRDTFVRFITRPFHIGDDEICATGTLRFDS